MDFKEPILVFDGDCGFCRRWVARWQKSLKERVDFAPYQEVAGKFPDIPLEAFQNSVQLLEEGRRYEGAQAVFRLLAKIKGKRWMLFGYEKIPGAARIAEWIYRLVARHRTFFSRLTRFRK